MVSRFDTNNFNTRYKDDAFFIFNLGQNSSKIEVQDIQAHI